MLCTSYTKSFQKLWKVSRKHMTNFDGSVIYGYLKFSKEDKQRLIHLSNAFHESFLPIFSARMVSLVLRNNLMRNSLSLKETCRLLKCINQWFHNTRKASASLLFIYFFYLTPCSITLNNFWAVTEWLKTADSKILENFNKSHKYLRKILMGDIIAREHIGLQVFAFCVVNVSDEHSRFKRNLRS